MSSIPGSELSQDFNIKENAKVQISMEKIKSSTSAETLPLVDVSGKLIHLIVANIGESDIEAIQSRKNANVLKRYY